MQGNWDKLLGYAIQYGVSFIIAILIFIIGKWVAQYEESQALTNAVAGRPVAQEEFDWDTIRGKEYDI